MKIIMDRISRYGNGRILGKKHQNWTANLCGERLKCVHQLWKGRHKCTLKENLGGLNSYWKMVADARERGCY